MNHHPPQPDSANERRPKGRALWLGACLLAAVWPLALSGAAAWAGQAQATFVVIVHPSNPASNLSEGFLAHVFLKRVTRWDNGDPIRPVDLHPDAPARTSFSNLIVKRSTAAVRSFWQQRIFSGRELPPPELASDEEVLRYVRTVRGAIGYVSRSAALRDVKAVQIR